MSALPSSVYANPTTPCFELASSSVPVPLTLIPAGPVVVDLNDTVNLTPTPAYPVVAGAEYDVQLIGYWELAGGPITLTAGDYAQVLVSFGTIGAEPQFGLESVNVQLYPDNSPVWGANQKFSFDLRKRVVCGTTLSNVVIECSLFATGPYPVASVTVTRVDIVRVA